MVQDSIIRIIITKKKKKNNSTLWYSSIHSFFLYFSKCYTYNLCRTSKFATKTKESIAENYVTDTIILNANWK